MDMEDVRESVGNVVGEKERTCSVRRRWRRKTRQESAQSAHDIDPASQPASQQSGSAIAEKVETSVFECLGRGAPWAVQGHESVRLA